MKDRYHLLAVNFQTQLSNVYKISEFDKDVLQVAINNLTELERNLREGRTKITNDSYLPSRAIKLLKDICESGPKRAKYQPVFNQSVVLMVSYFTSAISDVFNDTLTYFLTHTDELPDKLSKQEIKFSLAELSEINYDLSKDIGRMVARKADISFQDMQSISRAFKQYFNVEIEWDKHVNNIIAAQACRHAIVHHREIADDKCMSQLAHAKNRDVQKKIKLNDSIVFEIEELRKVGESMEAYFRDLCHKLLTKLSV